MDNNNPTQITQTPQQPVEQQPMQEQSPQVIQQADPSPTQDDRSGSNNNLVWVIVGLIVFILAAAGIYLYFFNKPSQPSSDQKGTTPQTQVRTQEDLESELNDLDVESEGSDFAGVDQDLQSL